MLKISFCANVYTLVRAESGVSIPRHSPVVGSSEYFLNDFAEFSKTHIRDRIFKLNLIHASSFNDLSDSLNSLKSLNSIKVLFHLGKFY